jgi:N-methylhydantoinase B
MWSAEDTKIRAAFDAGDFPANRDAVRAFAESGEFLGAKASNIPLGEDDLVQLSTFGGGGFGDPLERDPAAVATDLVAGLLSQDIAERIYGVALDTDGTVDSEATDGKRAALRAERIADAIRREEPISREASGPAVCRVLPNVTVFEDREHDLAYGCAGCGSLLCGVDQNYKQYCGMLDGSLATIDSDVFIEPTDVSVPMSYRTYVCLQCGAAFDNELAPADSNPSWDTKLDPDSVRRVFAATAEGSVE